MHEAISWRELAQRFASLQSNDHPFGTLRADLQYTSGGGQSSYWWLKDSTQSVRRRFRAIAELAGELLAPGTGDALKAWLDAILHTRINLTHNSPELVLVVGGNDTVSEVRSDSATIWNLCEASADFCLQLEAKRAKNASGTSAVRNAATATTEPATASAHPVPDSTATTTRGRKRGPHPAIGEALRVAEIVQRVAGDDDWRQKIDTICEALDQESIPFPKTWKRCEGWADYPEKDHAIKAIDYRLKQAGKYTISLRDTPG